MLAFSAGWQMWCRCKWGYLSEYIKVGEIGIPAEALIVKVFDTRAEGEFLDTEVHEIGNVDFLY